MIKKLFNKILNNPTIMSWTYNSTIFIHGLVVTPLLLIKFDDPTYSYWALMQTLLSLGLLADSGIGPTLQRSVSFFYIGLKVLPRNKKEYDKISQSEGTPNIERLQSLLSTATRIYLFISVVMIFFLTSVGLLVVWKLIHTSGHKMEFFWVFGVMVVNTYISMQRIKWSSFLRGLRKVALLNRFRTVMAAVRIIAFLSILLPGLGIIGLMIYLGIEAIISFFFMRYEVKKWFKTNGQPYRFSLKFDKEIFRSLWSVSWKSGLNTLGYFFVHHGATLIVAQIDDAARMANFLFTNRILGFIKRIAEAPFFANAPKAYSLMASKNFNKVKEFTSKNIFLVVLVLLTGLISFGLIGNQLLMLVGVDNRLVDLPIYIVLCLIVFFDLHGRIHGTLYISTNSVPFLLPSLITGAVIVSLGYYFSGLYGILGLVLIQLIANLFCNYWYSAYLSLKLIGWPFNYYLKDISINGAKYWINKIRKK